MKADVGSMVASAAMVSTSWAQVPTGNGLPATIVCEPGNAGTDDLDGGAGEDRCFTGEVVVNCEQP